MPVVESRRRFLALSSSTIVAMGVRMSSAPATPLSDHELTSLSARAAVKAMRDGDVKAETYAAALLAQAEQWKALNAFRTLHPDSVLEAARAADKMARARCAISAPIRTLTF